MIKCSGIIFPNKIKYIFIGLVIMLMALQTCQKFEREIRVTTYEVTEINYTSGLLGGEVIDVGEDGIDQHGFCYSLTENPTIQDLTIKFGLVSTPKSISTELRGLTHNTIYYVRAFAQNSLGEYYGEQIIFTTLGYGLPLVTTSDITDISYVSATVGGNVTEEGGAKESERGIWYGTSSGPEQNGTKLQIGSGIGDFSTSLSYLSPGTLYYVKAYVTNNAGSSYGDEKSFSTLAIDTASVTTNSVSELTETSATLNGNVIADGGAEVTERGFWFSTSESPETTGTKLQAGSGTGNFSKNQSGLTSGVVYFIKAFATNSEGTAFGEEISFQAWIDPLIDIDDNNYKTIQIGNQQWMAENLKVTHYSDGTLIQFLKSATAWAELSPLDKAYCVYNNDASYGAVYGALYTWSAAMNGAVSSDENPSGIQGICPSGWHLPSETEWQELYIYLGGEQAAGGKLKEAGTNIWFTPNTGATNESGFSAFPGGYRKINGVYENEGRNGVWWSSAENEISPENMAIGRGMYYDNSVLSIFPWNKESGFSVRCVLN